MTDPTVKTSKFLSLLLRHRPEAIGLTLDPQGWAALADLERLTAALAGPRRLTRAVIEALVAGPADKRRFELSADGARIRAVHGHSVAVDLALPAVEPPEILYHGTATRFLGAILAEGLRPRSRRHVHLSPDIPTARIVGARHGTPAILQVAAGALWRGGQVFHRSSETVWLTGPTPPESLTLLETP